MKTRKQISIIRLYKLANIFTQNIRTSPTIEIEYKAITEYLKFINDHKDDIL